MGTQEDFTEVLEGYIEFKRQERKEVKNIPDRGEN